MNTVRLIVMISLLIFLMCESRIISFAELESEVSTQPAPELILQTGHSQKVEAIVFSPDNRWVATGSFDNTIKIWEMETGRELRSLTGHAGAIRALACSPDGKLLISGGNDSTVRIWEVESGKEIKTFSDQEGVIEAVAISPDGKTLASGGSESTIVVRDLEARKVLIKLSGHTGSVSALAFSPDSDFVASGSSDSTARIWNLAKGKLKRTFKGHIGKIETICFSNSGEVLATGGRDKTIRLWTTASGKNLSILNGHTRSIIALNFISPDKLVSAAANREIGVWNTGKGSLVSMGNSDLANSSDEAESARFSPDATVLAIENGDGTTTIADGKSGRAIKKLENHTVGFYGVTFSPDRHWVASASFDNTIKLWDLQTGMGLAPLIGHTGQVTSVVFRPDGRQIFSASVDNTIRVWDTLTRKPLHILKGHKNSVSCLAEGSSGRMLVSGSVDKTIGIWDTEAKQEPRFLKGHDGEVISVSISKDERYIASASLDATIRIWDTQTGNTLRTIEPHLGELDAIEFSPDGKFIAAGGVDNTIRIWEWEKGNLLQILTGHNGKVNSVSFSIDGKHIVSSSQDRTIRTWAVADGKEERMMSGHLGPVYSACYSPDGEFISSASDDGSIIIWKQKDGERLSTLISLKNSAEWLVVTPEGFFDGSQSAWEQLSWRFDKSTFNVKPVEVFFSEFWSPGLLADLLNDRKIETQANILNKDRRQPKLELTVANLQPESIATARNIQVKIAVSEAPAGAKDVRLFRNGMLVKVWRGEVLKGQNAVTLETTIPLVAGTNRMTAYGFNVDGVKSRDATRTIVGADSLMRKGVAYILAIGLNEYVNSKYNLSWAVADAQEFAQELKQQQERLGKFDRVEIASLFNRQATKSNIVNELADIYKKIRPEDMLMIYFAGHGTARSDNFYLVPYDALSEDSQTYEEWISKVTKRSISDDELRQAVENIDSGQIVLVIDACESGKALESDDERRGPMNSKGLAQVAYEKGMYILTASKSDQAAVESAKLGHGYLTYALVEEGIKANLADREPKDGQILLREWLDFATERVPQIYQEEIAKGEKEGRELEREKSSSLRAIDNRTPQRPRVFYRREIEPHPFVVARP